MLLYRALCALFVAWAMNWSFSRPEAELLRNEIPEFAAIAPFAGALVGFVNLARRQGWGGIVAVANGMWAGFLSIVITSVIFVFTRAADSTARVGDTDTDFVFKIISESVAEVVDNLASFPLLVLCIGASAVVGLVTEVIHWALVKLRKRKGLKERNDRRAHRPSMY
ncbi:hypothetical protein LNKW23_39430 [Paralimibaculum aggregatum]|uniref:Uncharacterized protein n=1 Tax=Paralimibaculum aggregatum TaxID=3036245 RepID=A0ABQ6LR38_9RHOB|nr:hypothetical protein [Limibaculum sp. NKW23]GMG84727.1 hypothetical protein LNKW23_39430 [Limibaculum sp. NKW23]